MTPLAAKLLQQAQNLGGGKGFIINLAETPENLAKRLFKLLFKKAKHVVILKDFDIFHLDILQAIPLVEEESNYDMKQEIFETFTYDSKEEGTNNPRSCNFNLIFKECGESNEYPKVVRRGLKIAEKLRKKRRLVVNNYRRNFTSGANSSDIRASIDDQVQELLKLRKEHLNQPNTYYNFTRRLESLGEYFDKIIHSPKKPEAVFNKPHILKQSEEDQTNESEQQEENKQVDSNHPGIEVDVEINDGIDPTGSGRRILGIPTIPTRKPK